ncbi:hypothetical protein D3C80_1770960 [compost metagenome]
MLDLRIDPAETLKIYTDMVGQVDIAQQQVEWLQRTLHQTLQVFEALHGGNAVIAHAIEHLLQLHQLHRVFVGDQNPHGFVWHRL